MSSTSSSPGSSSLSPSPSSPSSSLSPSPSPSSPSSPRLSYGSFRLLCLSDIYSDHHLISLCHLISDYRTSPIHSAIPTLLILNGDFLGGSPLNEYFKGKNVMEIIRLLGVNIINIGNHEFDFGAEKLKEYIETYNYSYTNGKGDKDNDVSSTQPLIWLGSNVKKNDLSGEIFSGNIHEAISLDIPIYEGKEKCPLTPCPSSLFSPFSPSSPSPSPSTVRVSFFGLCTPSTPQLSYPGPTVKFDNVDECAKEMIHKIRGEENNKNNKTNNISGNDALPVPLLSPLSPNSPISPPDILISLTHLPLSEDRHLLHHHSSLSFIIGAHDHDPMLIMEDNTRFIMKVGCNGNHMGVIEMGVEVEEGGGEGEEGRRVNVMPTWKFINSKTARRTENCPLAAEMEKLLNFYRNEMETQMAKSENLEEILAYVVPTNVAQSGNTNEKNNTIASSLSSSSPSLTSSIPFSSRLSHHDITSASTLIYDHHPSPLLHSLFSLSLDDSSLLPSLLTRFSVVRRSPTPFAEIVADAMSHHYQSDGCQGAIINGGFIRGDSSYPAFTPITTKIIRNELPFPRVAVLMKISGRGLLIAMNQMMSVWPNQGGCYPHVSHQLRVMVEGGGKGRVEGKRIITHRTQEGEGVGERKERNNIYAEYPFKEEDINAFKKEISSSLPPFFSLSTPPPSLPSSTYIPQVLSIHINGALLSLTTEYLICCTSFMAGGGDGLNGFLHYGKVVSSDSWRVGDLVMKYLRNHVDKMECATQNRVRVV